jgi:hypothetical protein
MICGEHLSPLGGDDHLAMMRLRDAHQRDEERFGACEDDREVRCPLDDAREETDVFLSRPLKFGGASEIDFAAFDAAFAEALRLGFEYSVHESLCTHANGRDPYKPIN